MSDVVQNIVQNTHTKFSLGPGEDCHGHFQLGDDGPVRVDLNNGKFCIVTFGKWPTCLPVNISLDAARSLHEQLGKALAGLQDTVETPALA